MKLKFAIIPLFLVGLIVGIYLLLNAGRAAVEQLVPNAANTIEVDSSTSTVSLSEDPNQSVRPAIFRSVTERDEQLLLRGTAEPDVVVSIIGNGERRRQVRADKDGIWTAEIDVFTDDMLVLSLTTFLEDGGQINGDELLLRIVQPQSETSLDEDRLPENIGSSLILLTASGGPSRVIQTPFGRLPSVDALTLGPIEYDDLGGVIFSGFSSRVGRVRIFGNGELFGESRVGANGRWYLIAGETLPIGAYNIRVQLQESDGTETNIQVQLDRISPQESPNISPFVVFKDDVWHVRRTLSGGGEQYTAILSQESLITDEVQLELEPEPVPEP